MAPDIHLKSIRQIVADNLAELGMPELPCTRTTVITQNGFYFGQRFFFDRAQAIWLAAKGVIEFYGEGGELLTTVRVDQEPSRAQRAA